MMLFRCFSNHFQPYTFCMPCSFRNKPVRSLNCFTNKLVRSLNEQISNSDDIIHYDSPLGEDITHSYSPWDRLPNDVIEIIFGKLLTGDRVRLKLVCKLWNQLMIQSHIPAAPEAPWEILSDDSYANPKSYMTELRLKSLSEGRVYRFKLPMLDGQLDNIGWLCGHSRGWLVLAIGPNLNPYVLLWNPLSGAIHRLPPLSTLPFLEDLENFNYSGKKIQNLSIVIKRVEILSVGSNDYLVAALFHTPRGNQIAICTPRESMWIPFKVEQEDENNGIEFVDILFHTVEKKLMVLAINTFPTNLAAEKFKSKKFEVALMNCQVQVVPLLVPQTEEVILVESGFQICTPYTNWHLVESSITLGVLCVAAKVENINSFHNGEGIIPNFQCKQTKQLAVYDLDFKQEECEKEAVFIGATGSFLLPAVHGIVPGCVYFAIDEAGGRYVRGNNTEHFIIRETGQYFLTQGNKRIARNPFGTIRFPPASKIGWFIPQLFMR